MLAFALALALAAEPAMAQEPVPPDTTPAPTPAPIPLDGAEEAPTGPEVTDVRFEGVNALDTDLLRDAIATQATECRSPFFFLFCALGFGFAQEEHYLDRAELERDVERIELLYESWGFPDAAVEARVEPEDGDEVEVVFTVREGEPIVVSALQIRGLNALQPPVELPETLPLEVGDPYALPLLDSLQSVILRAFAERGRPYAQLEIGGDVNEAARTARLAIDIDPGPEVVFGETTIITERPLDEEVVRERLAWEPGEPISPSAIEETQRSLYALPIVERVVIEPVGLEEGATIIEPRITVETGRTSAIQLEGTVSSTECLEIAGFWRSRYFLGGPRLFSLGVGVGNLFADQLSGFPCTGVDDDEAGITDDFSDLNYFVQADLRQPWPGHPRTALLLSGYFVRETAPRVYVRRGYGGAVGIAREFRPELTGAAQYSPSRNELSSADIFFCATYGACSDEQLDELTELTWLSPLEAFLLWTPEGPPIQVRPPEPGERWRRWARVGLEGAALFTGSEYDYFRTLDEAGATRILSERSELALHTRIGLLAGQDELPPQVRLYSGGMNTVRGVPQNFLGPKVLVTGTSGLAALGCTLEPGGCPAGLVVDPDEVAVRPTGGELLFEGNVEGRHWLTNTLQLAAFADLGVIARDPWGSADALIGENWSALVTPGIGVRILTGLGPIRIDLGYDPSGARTIPLFTRDPETGDLVILGDVVYDPYEWDDPGFFSELWRRLQLQVAIGQPF